MTALSYPPGAIHAGRRSRVLLVRVWQQTLEPCPACEGPGLEILCEESQGQPDCELAQRCADCGYQAQAEAQQSILE